MSAADEEIRLAGEHGPVRVATLAGGRREVTAEHWDDAAFGLGWCVATDRPRQMDALRRTAQGRLAELAGPAAVPGDVLSRRLNLPAVARACWAGLGADQQRPAVAFAAGVGAAWPDGLDPWTPIDSVAVTQVLFAQLCPDGSDVRMVEVLRRTLPAVVAEFLLSTADPEETDLTGAAVAVPATVVPLAELRALMAEPPERQSRIVVAEGRPAGSNAWAVSDGGRAMLANDMHLPLTAPATWYPAVLRVGSRTVTGATVPGIPLLVSGENGSLAWGFTRLAADAADLHELPEVLRPVPHAPAAPDEVLVRTETIAVRGAAALTVEVHDTVVGPVVGSLGGRWLAFSSLLTEPTALDFGAGRLYLADDVEAGIAVVTGSGLPPVNAVLADAAGRVAWTVGGRHRRRSGGPRGVTPVTGSAPEPFDRYTPQELPRLVRSRGAVVNANNGNQLVRAAGLGWNWFGGGRAARIGELIRADGDRAATVEAAAAAQLDVDAGFYRYYRDLVVQHVPARSAVLRALRDEVLSWRGRADVDELGLALLVAFRECLREAVFSSLTGPAQRYDSEFTYCHHGHEPILRAVLDGLGEGLVPAPWRGPAHFVAGQLMTARDLLTRRTGTPGPVRWGEVNGFDPLPVPGAGPVAGGAGARSVIELAGCMETVRVTAPDFGPALRLAVRPGQADGGRLGIPGAVREAADGLDEVGRWALGQDDRLLPGAGRTGAQ